LITPVETLTDKLEHIPIEPSNDVVSIIDEVPFVVEVSIDEVSRTMYGFSGDGRAHQIGEVPGDISTIDEEPIGTEASRSVIDFLDGSYLLLIVEDVMHDQLFMEGRLLVHVDPMVEEDEQPSLEAAIHEEKLGASATSRVFMLSNGSPLQVYIDGACSIIWSPPHVGEREFALPRQITWFGHTSKMGRHDLHKVQHLRDGGLIPCMVVCAFDPSLRVGWQEILSWYPVELARRLDVSVAIDQQRLWITRGA